MLPQLWSGTTNLPPRRAQLVGWAEMGQLARLGMFDIHKKLARAEMLVFSKLGHGMHRRKTDPPLLAHPKQFMHLLLLEPLVQIHLEHVLVLGPVYTPLKNLPACPLGIAHEVNQAFPLVFLRNH